MFRLQNQEPPGCAPQTLLLTRLGAAVPRPVDPGRSTTISSTPTPSLCASGLAFPATSLCHDGDFRLNFRFRMPQTRSDGPRGMKPRSRLQGPDANVHQTLFRQHARLPTSEYAHSDEVIPSPYWTRRGHDERRNHTAISCKTVPEPPPLSVFANYRARSCGPKATMLSVGSTDLSDSLKTSGNMCLLWFLKRLAALYQ